MKLIQIHHIHGSHILNYTLPRIKEFKGQTEDIDTNKEKQKTESSM